MSYRPDNDPFVSSPPLERVEDAVIANSCRPQRAEPTEQRASSNAWVKAQPFNDACHCFSDGVGQALYILTSPPC